MHNVDTITTLWFNEEEREYPKCLKKIVIDEELASSSETSDEIIKELDNLDISKQTALKFPCFNWDNKKDWSNISTTKENNKFKSRK